MKNKINSSILNYIKSLETTFVEIQEDRQVLLSKLSLFIKERVENGDFARITVICTHNSRRSHLGQLWLQVAADYFNIENVETYSGGTEATAFNPRMVAALRRVGFDIVAKDEDNENPKYEVKWSAKQVPYIAFSKKYTASPNPQNDFAAMIVCNSADKGCPIVMGATARYFIPYDDPKAFDDTALESQKYDERCEQIGREMLWVIKNVLNN